MKTHTPGPWVFEWSNDVGPDDDYYIEFFDVLDGKGNKIAQVDEKVDARLIAAAPELLAAAQAMLAVCYDLERNDETLTAVKKTMTAIAKATGENP